MSSTINSHTLEMLRQLDQSMNQNSGKDGSAFNRAMQQVQGNQPVTIPAGPNAQAPGTPGNPGSSGTGQPGTGVNPDGSSGQGGSNSGLPGQNQGQGQNQSGSSISSGSTTAAGKVIAGATFNATGNLISGSSLNDFRLLGGQQSVIMQQVMAMSRTISATQAAALQPSVMISVGMLQKLYDLIEITRRSRTASMNMGGTATNTAAAAAASDDIAAAQQAQVLSFLFIERYLKIFENGEKYNIFSRFFKKGPLGENEHEIDTDDEYGNSFADVDAEVDYIKRPRRDRPGMSFHHSLLR